ncbi:hypothetical protein SBI_07366 [Streptomyces bingchenggensis BCW-1]|uniref:Uncharacterized protein n=1 Tax=Streptomyces bingchenggensis (strain BCW-1) TaxID=749414 RepID=D7C7D2_STRBB|nr:MULTISPECIES: hypothetical protein [Streptomyces]ADI10486.1 hypothetical protein SBI_07366 [Streptomyces bingchenggensis BCW-1]
MLATGRYADAVQADHGAAVAPGARGVPFTVLGDRFAIPGAAGTRQYTAVIDQAWGRSMADASMAPPLRLVETGPDGGWCDAATGICTTVAADREGPLPESEAAASGM